jgi:AraC-like DNA-binding protein
MTVSGSPHAIPGIHALHLAEVCARFGVSSKRLFADTGLAPDALAEPDARVPLSALVELVERARSWTGEPGLGFHVGLQMRIASHGYVGLAAMTASTVADAVAIAVRYAPTRTSALSLRLELDDDEARLVIEEHADFGSARDAVLFALIVGLWKIGNALTGLELAEQGSSSGPAGADVSFVEPAYYARFASLGPRVRFDRPRTCLRFGRRLLEQPLVTGDPAASRLTLEQCERELAALAPRAALRVRASLAKPSGGFRSLEEVARDLHVSARTLKRRLADEGTSFRRVLDEARRARAEELLRSPRHTLDAIAAELGYGDAAAFSRAFRRWTGMSPGAYRARKLTA